MRRLLLLSLFLLLVPATARAAEVHVSGNTVVYTAAPGEANDFLGSLNRFEGDANRFYVEDGVPVSVGTGCEQDDNGTHCQLGPGGTLTADLGDANDRGTLQTPGSMAGGPGDDKLAGSNVGPQTLDGGDGADELTGDAAGYCSEGAQDTGAPDVLIGGTGSDTVVYGRNVRAESVSIDGQANDGQAGEGDDVHTDIENVTVTGCGGSSTVTGSDGPNVLQVDLGDVKGQGGDDTITADGSLDGGDGNDKLTGLGGNDVLTGGAGDDYLEGGFGDDRIDGGAGKDSYVGDTTAPNTIGVGNDVINARDGVAESVACGPGSDTATVDADDDVAVDTQNLCEQVDRATATTQTKPGASGPTFVFVASTPVKLSRKKRSGRVKVTCLAAAGCNGRLKLTKGKKTLAGKAFSIAPKKSAKITLKLSKKAYKKLKKSQTLLVTATSKPAGSVVSVKVKLKK